MSGEMTVFYAFTEMRDGPVMVHKLIEGYQVSDLDCHLEEMGIEFVERCGEIIDVKGFMKYLSPYKRYYKNKEKEEDNYLDDEAYELIDGLYKFFKANKKERIYMYAEAAM